MAALPPVGHDPGMDDTPSARELRTAARACTFLAYAAGLAGVAAGTLVLRDGQQALAVIVWVITFAVGAALMGVAIMVRSVIGLTVSLTRIESDVRVLLADRNGGLHTPPGLAGNDDPWSGHPPY